MKVNVFYTVLKWKSIEIDDKYKRLIDDDNSCKVLNLTHDLNKDMLEKIKDIDELITVWSEDYSTRLYRN